MMRVDGGKLFLHVFSLYFENNVINIHLKYTSGGHITDNFVHKI